MNVYEIGNKIQRLPEHLIPEVLDYIEFLINRYGDKQVEQNQKKKFKFDWEGGLSESKTQYTAIELQHKSSDWR